jgi:hypothetical protein
MWYCSSLHAATTEGTLPCHVRPSGFPLGNPQTLIDEHCFGAPPRDRCNTCRRVRRSCFQNSGDGLPAEEGEAAVILLFECASGVIGEARTSLPG